MQNKESQKLRNCPFCGGEAHTYTCSVMRKGKLADKWLAHCKKCGLNYPVKKACNYEFEAIEAWNRRYTPPTEIDFDYGAED